MSTFRKIFKIITTNRFSGVGVVVVISTIVILFPQVSFAAASEMVTGAMVIFANGLIAIAQMLGGLLTTMVELLIRVANVTNFEDEVFVVNAWRILRDLANMFFIIALLFIAVATILRLEAYSAQRLLFKLVLMAVLINFSKSIVGFIIQIAQIFMVFFAQALDSAGGLLITKILYLQNYLSIAKLDSSVDLDMTGVLGAIVLAIILLLIGLVVIGVILVILLFRILMLWILIIMSPLVFLLHAVPAGTKYASQWWGTFSKYVISGPILVFFVWLALFAASSGDANFDSFKAIYTEDPNAGAVGGITSISSPKNLLSFLIGIGFLIGGLMAAQQMGVMGSGMAGKAIGRLQNTGTNILKGTAKRVGYIGAAGAVVGGVVATGGLAAAPLAAGALGAMAGMGARGVGKFGLRKSNVPFLSQWARDSEKKRLDKRHKKMSRFMEDKMGMGESSLDALAGVTKYGKSVTGVGVVAGGVAGLALGGPLGLGVGAALGALGARNYVHRDTTKAAEMGTKDIRAGKADASSMGVAENVASLQSGQLYGSFGLSARKSHMLDNINGEQMTMLGGDNLPAERRDELNKAVAAYIKDKEKNGNQVNPAVQNYATGKSNAEVVDRYKADDAIRVDRLSDIDLAAHDRMKIVKEKFEANSANNGRDFFASGEFQNATRSFQADLNNAVVKVERDGLHPADVGLPARPISPEKMSMSSAKEARAEFEKKERILGALTKASSHGVTVGRFADQGNTMAVDFTRFQEELNKQSPEGVSSTAFRDGAGVTLSGNMDPVNQALIAMIEEQKKILAGAKTPEAQRAVLKDFGYGEEQVRGEEEKFTKQALDDADKAISKLAGNSGPIKLLNKSRRGQSALEVLRHEEAEESMLVADPDGKKRKEIVSSMSEDEKAAARAQVSKRVDADEILGNDDLTMKEYFADVLARRAEGSEGLKTRLKVLEAEGKTAKKVAVSASSMSGAPVTGGESETVPTDASITAEIQNNPEINQQISRVGQEGITTGKDYLSTYEGRYMFIRQLIRNLKNYLDKDFMEKQNPILSNIGQRIAQLDSRMPIEDAKATPLEIKAELQEAGINQEELEGEIRSVFDELGENTEIKEE